MNRISLTSSMRSNLLSLQNISRQVSSTQNKLATGNKVNSAIDNPSSYYTARSLNNRADDLNALLDSMGQAVSTIKAATTALEAGADFLEQATAVATSALETIQDIPAKSFFEEKVGTNGAVVTTAQELKDAVAAGKKTIVVYGKIDYFENEKIVLKGGQKLVGTEYFTGYSGQEKFSQINFEADQAMPAISLSDNTFVSDLKISYYSTNETSAGSLIEFSNGGEASIHNVYLTLKLPETGRPGISKAVVSALSNSTINISGNNQIDGSGWYISGCFAMGNSSINYQDNSTTDIFLSDTLPLGGGYGIYAWNKAIINIAQEATVNIMSNARGGIGIIGQSNTNISGKLNIDINHIKGNSRNYAIDLWGETNYDNNKLNITSSAVLNIKSTDDNWLCIEGYGQTANPNRVTIDNDAQINGYYNNREYNFVSRGYVNINTTDSTQHLSFSNLADSLDFSSGKSSSINWNKIISDKQEDEKKSFNQYQEILNQYDQLINDASYKGINLLKPDKLKVKFNENGTADLNITGKDMSAAVLGLQTIVWQNQSDIAQSLAEISAALKDIRNYSAELGNNYNIITSRQDFTENLINILTEGADKLTLADMNEESANMLALQTRQQLAINSLSLASQASQTVLKLF